MKQAFIYSLKVWLTSCIITPVLWALFFDLTHLSKQPISPLIFLSILFIILSTVVVSSLTWFVFFISITGLLKYFPTYIKAKILIMGEAVVVLTFAVFMRLFPGFDQKTYTLIMIGHCIIIGLGIWFYKLEPMAYGINQLEPAIHNKNTSE